MDNSWHEATSSGGSPRWVRIRNPTTVTSTTAMSYVDHNSLTGFTTYSDEYVDIRRLQTLGDRMADKLAAQCGCGRAQVCQWCQLSELWWEARRNRQLAELLRFRQELG